MPLTFIKGSSGSGKTYTLLTEMIRRADAEPARHFLIIVPEQFTMQTQRTLVSWHPRKSILNLEVVSLARLAHRVFAEVGFRGETLLEEIGKSFLLERTVLENRKELRYFGKNLARPENIAELKAMISELMLYDISPEKLASSGEDGLLGAKLRDAALIYGAFRTRLEGTYMTAEEIPDKLAELADRSELLRGSVIAFDGFTGFTPVQLRLIEKLMTLAEDVYVTVTADPETELSGAHSGTGLFGMSAEMAGAFSAMAYRTNTGVMPVVTVEHTDRSRQAASPELTHLEKSLFRNRSKAYGAPCSDLRILKAKNPRAEASEAARQICRLVREEGMRYRDIAIITGDLETYGDHLREITAEYGIPCFVDQKRKLILNPFIEFLRAALEAVSEDYSYEGIFRMLRSGMTDFDRNQTDRLENYIIGCGIRGKKRWRRDFIHPYRGEDPGEVPMLNDLRKKICALMDPLADTFSRRGSTVREKSEALYDFCVRSRAAGKLRAREKACSEIGREDLAREYAQVWPYVMGFLDKLVSVLGDEKISMRDYTALLEAGFAEARVAIIPPGNDRVLVGDVERSRIPEVKVLIFLGMNEGIVPKPAGGGGILTDLDRMKLAEHDIRMKPTARQAVYIERFYLYLALTKPSEKLIITFSASKTGGEAAHPAYIVDTLRKLFPKLPLEAPGEAIRDGIEREQTGISLIADGMREIGLREPGSDFLELFSHYRNHPDYADRIESLIDAANMRKPSDEIGAAAAKAVYGTRLNLSASRLERFCACEFRHFLDYGLRLRERPVYEFSGMNMGSVLHRTLEIYAGRLKEHGLDERCPEEELRAYADRALEEAVQAEGGESALHASERTEYQISRMRRLLHHSIDVLKKQTESGEFRLYGTEEEFRGSRENRALRFELTDGTPMVLQGRIDRIDVAESGDVSFVRVIDYKTGSTSFDLNRIYHGLQLQLALYMNASLEMLRAEGKLPEPAGMLYFPVRDPVVDYVDGEAPEELHSRRVKKMGISGAVASDPAVFGLLDRRLLTEGKTDYYPVTLKRDGTPDARSKVFDSSEFRLIGNFASKKAVDTGNRIMSGSTDVDPYIIGEETACTYCPYRIVCGFDPRIPGYQYRELSGQKKDEILACMEKALNGGDDKRMVERELDG